MSSRGAVPAPTLSKMALQCSRRPIDHPPSLGPVMLGQRVRQPLRDARAPSLGFSTSNKRSSSQLGSGSAQVHMGCPFSGGVFLKKPWAGWTNSMKKSHNCWLTGLVNRALCRHVVIEGAQVTQFNYCLNTWNRNPSAASKSFPIRLSQQIAS